MQTELEEKIERQRKIIQQASKQYIKGYIKKAEKYLAEFYKVFDSRDESLIVFTLKEIQTIYYTKANKAVDDSNVDEAIKYFNKINKSAKENTNFYQKEMQNLCKKKAVNYFESNKQEDRVIAIKYFNLYITQRNALTGFKPTVLIPKNEFDEWNDAKYNKANTAKNENYLTIEEKYIFYYLNLARLNPKLFAKTYLKQYIESNYFNKSDNKTYVETLIATLNSMEPKEILSPSERLYLLADCWAIEGGKLGVVTHDRTSGCSSGYSAECIDFGYNKGLTIVLRLLIDKGVPSLGHRKICLAGFKKLGLF